MNTWCCVLLVIMCTQPALTACAFERIDSGLNQIRREWHVAFRADDGGGTGYARPSTWTNRKCVAGQSNAEEQRPRSKLIFMKIKGAMASSVPLQRMEQSPPVHNVCSTQFEQRRCLRHPSQASVNAMEVCHGNGEGMFASLAGIGSTGGKPGDCVILASDTHS